MLIIRSVFRIDTQVNNQLVMIFLLTKLCEKSNVNNEAVELIHNVGQGFSENKNGQNRGKFRFVHSGEPDWTNFEPFYDRFDDFCQFIADLNTFEMYYYASQLKWIYLVEKQLLKHLT